MQLRLRHWYVRLLLAGTYSDDHWYFQIHDVYHPGVPNNRLIVEHPDLAKRFDNRSVAEQNSLDISWKLLMEARFKELVQTLCSCQDDLQRFRDLVVTAVCATDIADKECVALRNERWAITFQQDPEETNSRVLVNRKATIVIEHLVRFAFTTR